MNGKPVRALAIASALAIALSGCMKAGDGVGLTERGEPAIVADPCLLNPAAPGCPSDPCRLDPSAAGCAPDCNANPSAPGCPPQDSCVLDPSLPGCKPAGPDCSTLPKPVECLDREYFTANVLPIFKEKCETCHKQNGQAWSSTRLSLEASMAWDSLVNVASREMVPPKAPMLRVKPGMPDSSYLYVKIVSDKPPVGARMPMSSTPLTAAEIERIRAWITGKP